MTAPGPDVLAGGENGDKPFQVGQHVTWHDTEVIVLDADGPWLTLALPGCDVGWSAHESEVSAR